MCQINCPMCSTILNLEEARKNLKIVYESEYVLAFHSTRPFAEVHVVIISKKHIPTIFDLSNEDADIIIDMNKAITMASKEVISLKGACKMEMYLGGFQQVKHLHCHVIYDENID